MFLHGSNSSKMTLCCPSVGCSPWTSQVGYEPYDLTRLLYRMTHLRSGKKKTAFLTCSLQWGARKDQLLLTQADGHQALQLKQSHKLISHNLCLFKVEKQECLKVSWCWKVRGQVGRAVATAKVPLCCLLLLLLLQSQPIWIRETSTENSRWSAWWSALCESVIQSEWNEIQVFLV